MGIAQFSRMLDATTPLQSLSEWLALSDAWDRAADDLAAELAAMMAAFGVAAERNGL